MCNRWRNQRSQRFERGIKTLSYHRFNLLILGPEEDFTKIEWTYENSFSEQAPLNFYYASLADLPNLNLGEYDLCVLLLDLHQPVPFDSLSELNGVPGLACFVQPTPRQLVELFKVDNFKPLIWTGADYEQLVGELINFCLSNQDKIRQSQFFSFTKDWLKNKQATIEELHIVNPSDGWTGSVSLILDPSKGYYLLGAVNAKCDFSLPVIGDQNLAELSFSEGSWQLMIFGESHAPKKLIVGDEFYIDECMLRVSPSSDVQELSTFAKKAGYLSEATVNNEDFDGPLNKYCQRLLSKQLRGKLFVESNEGNGRLDFYDGVIVGAYAGVTKNLKAFSRILSWEEGLRVSFQPVEELRVEQDLHVNLQEFLALMPKWFRKFHNVKNQKPPQDLVLTLQREAFLDKKTWSAHEFIVACAVGQHNLVRDVINFCNLNDFDVVEQLIRLRHEGVIATGS